jgi:hypothetical protein
MPQFKLKGEAREFTGGYRIFINGAPNEHNPPHFHIMKSGETVARFHISNMEPMTGNEKLNRRTIKEISKYWYENRDNFHKLFCALNPKLCESRS